MAFTSQPNFIAKLDGVDVNELNKKLDYKKTSLEERKQLIENVLDETDFYTEYFSEHFKGDINSGDHTSSGINVCQSLEKMANYLLNSDEIKQMEDEEEVKYVFHSDLKYFQKKVDRESLRPELFSDDDSNDDVIHFLKKPEKNYKKEIKKTLTTNDIVINENRKRNCDDVIIDYLKENIEFLKYIDQQLENPTIENSRFKFTTAKGQVKEDFFYAKDLVMGTFGHKPQNLYESTEPNYDFIDFTNHTHLKGGLVTYVNHLGKEKNVRVDGLLKMVPNTFDLRDDMVHILWDLQAIIDKANLTDKEKEILSLIRKGNNNVEIGETLNVSRQYVQATFDRIAKKVSKTASSK